MGKKAGDSVRVATPNGVREFEIRAVQTIYEQPEA
jgi:transcription elongation GreA/GreB family factor